MTCPTCNGLGYTSPGIGIEVCTDCKGTGKIKNERMKNNLAFILCLWLASCSQKVQPKEEFVDMLIVPYPKEATTPHTEFSVNVAAINYTTESVHSNSLGLTLSDFVESAESRNAAIMYYDYMSAVEGAEFTIDTYGNFVSQGDTLATSCKLSQIIVKLAKNLSQ